MTNLEKSELVTVAMYLVDQVKVRISQSYIADKIGVIDRIKHVDDEVRIGLFDCCGTYSLKDIEITRH